MEILFQLRTKNINYFDFLNIFNEQAIFFFCFWTCRPIYIAVILIYTHLKNNKMTKQRYDISTNIFKYVEKLFEHFIKILTIPSAYLRWWYSFGRYTKFFFYIIDSKTLLCCSWRIYSMLELILYVFFVFFYMKMLGLYLVANETL